MDGVSSFVDAINNKDWDQARSIYNSISKSKLYEIESGDNETAVELLNFMQPEQLEEMFDQEFIDSYPDFILVLARSSTGSRYFKFIMAIIDRLALDKSLDFVSKVPDVVIQHLPSTTVNKLLNSQLPEKYTELETKLLSLVDFELLVLDQNTYLNLLKKHIKLGHWVAVFNIYSNENLHIGIEPFKLRSIAMLFPIEALPEIAEAHQSRWSRDPNSSVFFRTLLGLKFHNAKITEKPELDEIINQYFYPSGRPRTTMNFIPIPLKTGVQLWKKIVEGRPDNPLIADLEVGEHESLSIPILRYASGMSIGAYHKLKAGTKYCGTFYYFDIGSEFLLDTGKVLVAKNKLHAYYLITGTELLGFKVGPGYSKGDYSFLPFDEDGLDNDGRYYKPIYTEEDRANQPLCHAAKGKYDCVILLRMFGRNRIVTEVLDVRDRIESFDNIYRR